MIPKVSQFGPKHSEAQVVAGALYKFTLELEHPDKAGCEGAEGGVEECSMVVWEKVWADFREVQWDKSSCRKA